MFVKTKQSNNQTNSIAQATDLVCVEKGGVRLNRLGEGGAPRGTDRSGVSGVRRRHAKVPAADQPDQVSVHRHVQLVQDVNLNKGREVGRGVWWWKVKGRPPRGACISVSYVLGATNPPLLTSITHYPARHCVGDLR